MRPRLIRILRWLYFALMFIATGFVTWLVVMIGLSWGILIGDINPDRMPPLTGVQQETVYHVTHPMMLLASVSPLLLSMAWAVTAMILLVRRRNCPACGMRASRESEVV